jgi:phosphatidylserine/phosphatidylglycerophosphate/cardiolipin synthase-like enzyme
MRFALPSQPRIELHYAPVENLEKIDVDLIDSAGETIDMDAYVLTDWAVIDALADAAGRGVVVRLFRETSTSAYGDVAELAKLAGVPNVAQKLKPAGALMHLKSYCVDGRVLRTGSANFSGSGEKNQDNDLLILRDPVFAAAFEANFERQWSGEPVSKDIAP